MHTRTVHMKGGYVQKRENKVDEKEKVNKQTHERELSGSMLTT